MNSMTLQDAREAIKIDKFNLDEELVQQPILYETVAAHAVVAQSRADKLKKDREQTEYTLAKDIRSYAAQTGTKKTEKGIDEEIKTTPAWYETQEEYEQAVTTASQWSVMQEAFKQRAFMLRDLVQLSISQYNMSNSDAQYAGKKALLAGAKTTKPKGTKK